MKHDPGVRGWPDTQPEEAKGEGAPTEPQIPHRSPAKYDTWQCLLFFCKY